MAAPPTPSPHASGTPGLGASGTPGLGVRGVRLSYHPAHPVIEDLTTAVTPGAVTMIVGPNACGKNLADRKSVV